MTHREMMRRIGQLEKLVDKTPRNKNERAKRSKALNEYRSLLKELLTESGLRVTMD